MLNGRNETELERCDRHLVELLQEVRVVQTGVQVLFGFLLAVAFTVRFQAASTFDRIDYFVTLLATGCAAILLIAPTAHHRILFRMGDKRHLVVVANRFLLAGLASIALAIVSAVVLVSNMMFGMAMTIVTSVAMAIGCAFTWYVLPIGRKHLVLGRRAPAPSAEEAAALVASEPTISV